LARPIRTVEAPASPDELTRSLEGGARDPVRDQEALTHFLDLLRVLDERGVLRLLGDLASANEEILRVSVDRLSRPGTVRALQNLRVLWGALERIEPARLQRLVDDLDRAMDRGSRVAASERRLGALALLRELGEPQTNRGLRVLLAMLKEFGAEGP
jgi:uncharacterized protein YjgD (DUF1641 family)